MSEQFSDPSLEEKNDPAYQDGYKARLARQSYRANPFVFGSENSKMWCLGYVDAFLKEGDPDKQS